MVNNSKEFGSHILIKIILYSQNVIFKVFFFGGVWEQKIKIIFKVDNTAKSYTIITMHHPIPSNLPLTFFFNSVKQNQKETWAGGAVP